MNRLIRKLANSFAKLYEDGPKKNTFVLDDKGEHIYTVENQDKLNEESDIIYDKYEETLSNIMGEVIGYYIETTDKIPDSLPIEFRNSLSLLISDEN